MAVDKPLTEHAAWIAQVVEEQSASDDVSQTMESNPEVTETSAPEGALEGAEEPTKHVDG